MTITVPFAAIQAASAVCNFDKSGDWQPTYIFDFSKDCPAIFGTDGNAAVKVSWVNRVDEKPPYMSDVWGLRFAENSVKGLKFGPLVEIDLENRTISDGNLTAPIAFDADSLVTTQTASAFESPVHAQAQCLRGVKDLVEYQKLWDQTQALEAAAPVFAGGRMAEILNLEKFWQAGKVWFSKREVQLVRIMPVAGTALRFVWPCWHYLGLRVQMQAVLMSYREDYGAESYNYSLRISESVEE